MKYLGRIYDPKDLVTKEYVDKGDVFIAIYGETTYSQVDDARTAGKVILAASPTYDSVHVFNADIAGEEFSFTMPSGNNYVSVWSLEDNDNWTSSQVDFGTTDSFYTTSSTTAATAAKTTETVSGYTLRAGNIISVKFTNANTANAPTLKVGSTRAKAIWYQGAVTSSTNTLTWNAGDALTFIYTGSAYLYIGRDSNVFIATYGTTTYAEIENAYNANIPIIVKDTTLDHTATGTTNIYQLLDKTLLGFRFSSINNYLTVKFCFVNTSNTWSYQSRMGLYKVNGKTSNDTDSDPGAITLKTSDLTNDSGYITASDDITGTSANVTGTVDVIHGGTGKTTWTANYAVITGSSATGAFQQRAITNNTANTTALTRSTNLVTMNTLSYGLNRTTALQSADTNYTTYMARGEALFTTETTPTNNGQIAWVYG